ERYCHVVSFNKDDAPVVRRYIGNGTPCLEVDEIADSDVTVRVDEDRDGVCETTLSVGQCELGPANADKGPEPEPWRELWLPTWATYRGVWPRGCRIEVEARYGWPAVPAAIKDACIVFAAMYLGQSI